MPTLLQNRPFTRVISLVLLTAAIIFVSWRLASPSAFSSSVEDAYAYLAESPARTNTTTDELILSLQDRLRASPDDWESYSQLGLAFLQKARETGDPTYYLKTEQALEKALSLQPGDYASLSAKGALALARHDFPGALQWGEQARQINSDRAYAYGVIADAQIELGRYQDAIQTLQRMVDLRPDMSSYSRVSYIRELHGDVDGALEMMQLAVDSGLPTSENTAWVRTQLANLYFNSGNFDQAELEYRLTLQNRPDYVYALAGLARVQAAQDETDEALQLLNRAVTIMPMPEFVIALGELYQATGHDEQARQQFQLLETIEKLYRANGVDMDMEIALFNADHDRNLDETLTLAREAYTRRPSIQGADVLAWALYKTGNYEEARRYSQEALRLGTKDSLKLFHAGMIALKLNDPAAARKYLEQALAINPHFSVLYAREAKVTLQALP